MKTLYESILSSTDVGKASYGPWSQLVTDIKNEYKNIKFLAEDNRWIYIGGHLNTSKNDAFEKIQEFIENDKCLYCGETKKFHTFINNDSEDGPELLVQDKYGYPICYATYFTVKKGRFQMVHQEPELKSISKGDLVIQIDKSPSFIDPKNISKVLEIVKKW